MSAQYAVASYQYTVKVNMYSYYQANLNVTELLNQNCKPLIHNALRISHTSQCNRKTSLL